MLNNIARCSKLNRQHSIFNTKLSKSFQRPQYLNATSTFINKRSIHTPLPLNFEADALEPHFSKQTIKEHFKLYTTYMERLNDLIEGTEYMQYTMEQSVPKLAANAETAWEFKLLSECMSHEFYFQQFTNKEEDKQLSPLLEEQIQIHFESAERLKQRMVWLAQSQFNTGWVWLMLRGGQLELYFAPAGENVFHSTEALETVPLLAFDASDHAYFAQYGTDMDAYVEAWWNCIDFKAAEQRLVTGLKQVGLYLDEPSAPQ